MSPRATVTWDVQTLDASGKGVPADVSLALVDKAVLTLASDQAGQDPGPLLQPAQPRACRPG